MHYKIKEQKVRTTLTHRILSRIILEYYATQYPMSEGVAHLLFLQFVMKYSVIQCLCTVDCLKACSCTMITPMDTGSKNSKVSFFIVGQEHLAGSFAHNQSCKPCAPPST